MVINFYILFSFAMIAMLMMVSNDYISQFGENLIQYAFLHVVNILGRMIIACIAHKIVIIIIAYIIII